MAEKGGLRCCYHAELSAQPYAAKTKTRRARDSDSAQENETDAAKKKGNKTETVKVDESVLDVRLERAGMMVLCKPAG